MLSDDSSSDSETGRFKGRSKNHDEQTHNSTENQDAHRSLGRSRTNDRRRYNRDYERKRHERDYNRRSRERQRYSRHSPVSRRRRSREKSSSIRKSHEQHKRNSTKRDSTDRSHIKHHRSSSRDGRHTSRSVHHKPCEHAKDLKEEKKTSVSSRIKSPDKNRKSKEKVLLSPDHKENRSAVHKPQSMPQKRKSSSPIVIEDHENSDISEDVQPGSYYSMIPAVVKEKSEESSEIDSSDDERLRAKLLNLEKELHKTHKKKHKKKHKKRSSKVLKDKDNDITVSAEVTSTTDIQEIIDVTSKNQNDTAEVSSTLKSNHKESSEEGEISSDDNSQDQIEIDPSDLRHKLRRSGPKHGSHQPSNKGNVCGPALPPHLASQGDHFRRSVSPNIEGPALPPHFQKRTVINIGPSIPEGMRRVLAENDHDIIRYESPDEDGIGPLPVGSEDRWSEAHQRLEERALDMKIRKLDGHTLSNPNVKSREQWMLELPEGKAKYLGLEARSFRAKQGPDMSDRSSWTDTPEEKARKAAGIVKQEDADVVLKREANARHITNRDEEQEAAVKKHKKKHKRDESLLELHQKKLKKKKKKEEKEEDKKERRPFSRDVDLQVNRFDEAQKKSIIKKAQALDSRFSSGEAKYL